MYLHVAIHTAAICAQIQCCSCIFSAVVFCAIMQCPTCRMGRSRRYWKPSQWNKFQPVTDSFIHCRICSGKLPEDGMGWEWTQEREAVLPRRARGPQPMPGHIPHSALQLAETAVRFNTKAFGKFVLKWLNRVPPQTLKNWSYNGAVKSGRGDPIHYRCPYTLQDYFDPGNWIYA